MANLAGPISLDYILATARECRTAQGETPMALIFKGGTLIDGTGKFTENATVIVQGSKIVVAGVERRVTWPEGEATKVINAEGMSILPGLIDLHVHLHGQGEAADSVRSRLLNESEAYQGVILAENAHRTLEAGFTTIRDMGAPNDVNIAISRAVNDGVLKQSPRIVPVATIRMTTLPGGYDVHGTRGGVTGPQEARRTTREKIAAGAEVIHVVATGASFGQFGPHTLGLSVEEMHAALEEAHKLEKKTTAHACGAQGMKNAVLAGTQCIEHGQWLYADGELLKMVVDRRIGWIPTLMNNPAKLEKMKEAQAKGGRSGLPAYVETRVPEMVDAHRRSYEIAMQSGVLVALGSDCGAPFTPNGTNAVEMEFFVRYGATAMQAIEAGTRLAAEVLGLENLVGTLEAGKEADLILVSGDPLKDIRILQDKENIKMVVKGGEVLIDRGVDLEHKSEQSENVARSSVKRAQA
jgi:imidazolonepropionase-like amidohydrolase